MNWKRFLLDQLLHCLLAVLCLAVLVGAIVGLLLACIYFVIAAPLIVAIDLYIKASEREKSNGSDEENKD